MVPQSQCGILVMCQLWCRAGKVLVMPQSQYGTGKYSGAPVPVWLGGGAPVLAWSSGGFGDAPVLARDWEVLVGGPVWGPG